VTSSSVATDGKPLHLEDGDLVGRLADGFQGTDTVVSFVEENRKD